MSESEGLLLGNSVLQESEDEDEDDSQFLQALNANRSGLFQHSTLNDSLTSIKTFIKNNYPSLTAQKFLAAMVWALFAIGLFNLIFLPRTSLGRDYRRLHFSKLSKVETQRLYLKHLRYNNRTDELLQNITRLDSHVGNLESIDFTKLKFEELGFKPILDTHKVVLNEPDFQSLQLLDNKDTVVYNFPFEEPISPGSSIFNPYSPNGDVVGGFLFCGYGSNQEYATLLEQGEITRGRIHIIKYSKISNDLKLANAKSNGAIGVVFYQDPSDDGLYTVANGFKEFPEGPARNLDSIEGLSVAPVTSFNEGINGVDGLTDIPCVPMSSRDVSKLQKLSSDYKLRLANRQNHTETVITNVYYEIPGLLNEKIVLGVHRDSILRNGTGAGDPGSGESVLFEISRSFSELVSKGWKPLRTIIVVSFDANNYGHMGSLEFLKKHSKDLSKNCIGFFDIGGGVTGSSLSISSNPILSNFLLDESARVPFNESTSLSEYFGKKVGNLRNDHDYPGFQYHYGIPSCSISFVGEGEDSPLSLNSRYDTYEWISKYIDPGFKLHNVLAQYVGLLVVTMSESEVIRYDLSHYAEELSLNFEVLKAKTPTNWLHDHGIHELIIEIESLISDFMSNSEVFDVKVSNLQEQITIDYPWFKFITKIKIAIEIKILRNRAKKLDRVFLDDEGLAGRPWMKHLLFAPKWDVGIEGDLLPGLHESVEKEDFQLFSTGLQKLLNALDSANKVVSL